MGARFGGPVRVGLLTPYFAFFEARFPADFRQTQQAYADRLADSLRATGLGVAASGLVDGPEAATETRRRFAVAGLDVVVAAATMAAPVPSLVASITATRVVRSVPFIIIAGTTIAKTISNGRPSVARMNALVRTRSMNSRRMTA